MKQKKHTIKKRKHIHKTQNRTMEGGVILTRSQIKQKSKSSINTKKYKSPQIIQVKNNKIVELTNLGKKKFIISSENHFTMINENIDCDNSSDYNNIDFNYISTNYLEIYEDVIRKELIKEKKNLDLLRSYIKKTTILSLILNKNYHCLVMDADITEEDYEYFINMIDEMAKYVINEIAEVISNKNFQSNSQLLDNLYDKLYNMNVMMNIPDENPINIINYIRNIHFTSLMSYVIYDKKNHQDSFLKQTIEYNDEIREEKEIDTFLQETFVVNNQQQQYYDIILDYLEQNLFKDNIDYENNLYGSEKMSIVMN